MSRTNLDPLFTFPDGSHLVIGTQCLKTGDFSCTLYTAIPPLLQQMMAGPFR